MAMSTSITVFKSVVAGATFGAALTASEAHLPGQIVAQTRLTNFHMFQVFLTAGAVSAYVMFSILIIPLFSSC